MVLNNKKPYTISLPRIQGHIAMWATRLHPYHLPPNVNEVNRYLKDYVRSNIRSIQCGDPVGIWFYFEENYISYYENADQLIISLSNILKDHHILKLWSTPYSKQKVGSNEFKIKEEEAYIDLDEFFYNVANSIFEEVKGS